MIRSFLLVLRMVVPGPKDSIVIPPLILLVNRKELGLKGRGRTHPLLPKPNVRLFAQSVAHELRRLPKNELSFGSTITSTTGIGTETVTGTERRVTGVNYFRSSTKWWLGLRFRILHKFSFPL